MNIIKRNGTEAVFDRQKIVNAITKANNSVNLEARMKKEFIDAIAADVEGKATEHMDALNVEDIQDMVVFDLMKYAPVVASSYIKYRHTRELVRKANTTDDKIFALVNLTNEEAKQENSNKDPVINSTQRDYMAGEVSRDITQRLLLPKDIVGAHKDGIIHA